MQQKLANALKAKIEKELEKQRLAEGLSAVATADDRESKITNKH